MVHGIFDSHAHYDDSRFDPDRLEVLSGLPQQGIARVVNVGADMESSHAGIRLAEQFPFLYSSVGVHPHSAQEIDDTSLAQLAELSHAPKVVAIGEIGLDYFYEPYDQAQQIAAFEAQLALAKDLDLPVIIHSRSAQNDTLELLRKYRPKGIVHCFSGAVEMAKAVLKLDMYLGFTGALTFKNARKAVEVVEYAPLDRLLLETDCPYMAPEPNRGKRCDSSMIAFTAARMAQCKDVTTQEMIDIAYQNTCRVYEIEP